MNLVYDSIQKPEAIDITSPIHAWLQYECETSRAKMIQRRASVVQIDG